MSASANEVADRLALRDLVQRYARAVDRRDAALLDSLFVDDAEMLVFQDPSSPEPTSVISGRAEFARITTFITRYAATTHFIGNHLVDLDSDVATGETYCLAGHIYEENGQQRIDMWSIRYEDRYVRRDGRWYFQQRRLIVDWTDDRPLRVRERLRP